MLRRAAPPRGPGRRRGGAARSGSPRPSSDVDAIVVNAAGCGSHLKEAELGVRVVDVSELLAELGPRAKRSGLPIRVAYQDACHLGHAQGIRDAPRVAAAHDPRPRARRAGRAGDLLRERRDLQPGSARGGRGARRSGRRRTSPGPARRRTPAPTRAASCRSRTTSAGRAGRLPALHPVELARRVDPGRLRRPVVRRRAPLAAAPEPLLDRLRQRRRDVAIAANTGPVVRDPREPRSTEQDRKDPPRHAEVCALGELGPQASRRAARSRRGSRGRARAAGRSGSSMPQLT